MLPLPASNGPGIYEGDFVVSICVLLTYYKDLKDNAAILQVVQLTQDRRMGKYDQNKYLAKGDKIGIWLQKESVWALEKHYALFAFLYIEC